MTEGIDDSDLWDELLSPGIRFAWKVAAQWSRDGDGPDVPAPLVPLVRFRRLPGAASGTIRRALDDDEEFRTAVAGHDGVERLDRASFLYLTRPEGWKEELDDLVDAVAAADADEEERRATERVAQLEVELTAAREVIAAVEEQSRRTEARRQELQDAQVALEARIVVLEGEIEAAGDSRRRAVRELKLTEKRLAQRTEQWKSATESLAARVDAERTSEVILGPDDAPLPSLSDDDAAELVAHVEALGVLLRNRGLMEPDVGRAPDPSASRHRSPSSGPRRGRPGGRKGRQRRRAPRLGRGLVADSPPGVEWLASCTGAVILVDGYNVAITTWGHLDIAIQRDRLRAISEAFGARTGAEIHLVFDGTDDVAPVASRRGSGVRSEFTPEAVEADDRILEMIGQVPADRPLTVISDDRRVREGAENRGAAVAGVAAFVDAAG